MKRRPRSAHSPSRSRTAPARRRTPARRRGGPRPGADSSATRAAVFAAAAAAFSRRGFDGVAVDDIARAAGVNKAMIYYHFADKLALYREIVCEMLRAAGTAVTAIADGAGSADAKLAGFVAAFVALSDERPYFPPMMVREIAEGAPHLDADALLLMRSVFTSFARILDQGQRAGRFRPVNPVLAYMTVIGPLVLNAARERVGQRPGRGELPMFVHVPHPDLMRHMQGVALRMLQKD